jgi:uncharacterized damage-inducible protein DinB
VRDARGEEIQAILRMNEGIHFDEFLGYLEEENRRWKQFFERHPEALNLPLDIAGDVRSLVLHVFAVELYFANALSAQPARDADKLAAANNLDDIFAISGRAGQIYREFFATAKPEDWSRQVELSRIGGTASKRKLVAQAFTHSLRHWAQISTYLRQQGLKQEWHHDLLMSKAME